MPGRRSAPGSPPPAGDLASLERWMREVLTDPAGPDAALARTGVDPGAVVSRLPHLSPIESLRIYGEGYFVRLLECLRQDFPALSRALGSKGFESLCRGYLGAFPSRSYNIAHAGGRMAEFVEGRRGLRNRRFLLDLARLEWAVTSFFDLEAAAPISVESLRGVPPERFARARFEPARSAAVLDFAYPVNAYMQAVLDGKRPRVPEARPTSVAVYRQGQRVWRMPLTPPMRSLLGALLEGRTLEESVDRCRRETKVGEAWLAARVTAWFREWVGGGMFAAIRMP